MAAVVVVGAGMVGAACAFFLARDGHRVTVLDRGPVAGGSTSRGEGNVLVSDKDVGAELDLALWSARLWRELAAELGAAELEWEPKGGVVVASGAAAHEGLLALADRQRRAGVDARPVAADRLHELEPHLADGLAGGVHYPQDQQVQPVRAAAALLRAAKAHGALVRPGTEVLGPLPHRGEAIGGVRTATGDLPAELVVNAAGTWGGEVAERLGAAVPVLPRRGFVLVTAPLPPLVRHKVYSADYVANVASAQATLETSVVVEGTQGGTVLIGASRERVGFDPTIDLDVVRILARHAVELFPALARARLLRVYRGFRPYCPDHLPVIGPDQRVPGLYHACGHEGAGIGLSAATGALIADQVAGRASPVDASPFDPGRFAAPTTGVES